jgi:hypothetical protein
MSTYIYESNNETQTSTTIATDKVRISTTTNSILFATGFPNTSGTGTVTAATNSATVTGSSTTFTTQLGQGYWIGNSTGITVGIVESIANNTSLTLTTNANVAITTAGFTYSPYGQPYVDDVLDPSNCPRASGIVPSNTVLNTVFVGQGNVITFVNAETSNCIFSVTELGEPHANTGTSGF